MPSSTHSEEYRHQCEVRWCISQGADWFKDYVRGVATARGREAARRLTADVKAQAAAGNHGAYGVWMNATKQAKAPAGSVATC